MSLNFTIFPSARSLEGGLIRSLTVTAQDRVKTLVAGDTEPTTIQIRGDDGQAIDPTGYTIRVGIGGINLRPEAGSGTLSDGVDTVTIPHNATAAQVQTLLNGMNSGAGYDSAGDCAVTGNDGGPWFVLFDDPGAVDLPTLDGEGLSPASLVSAAFTQEGDGSTRAGFVVRFFQQPLVYQETWTNNDNDDGVEGILNLGREGVYRLLGAGETSFQSFLEFEITTPDGDISTVARQAVTITGEVIGKGAGGTVDFSNFITANEAGNLYLQTDGANIGGNAGTLRTAFDVFSKAESTTLQIQSTSANVFVSFSSAGNTDFLFGTNARVALTQFTASAGTGAYTRTITLTTAGREEGDTARVVVAVAASDNPTVEIRNATSGGTLLRTFSGTGIAYTFVGDYYFATGVWRESSARIQDANFLQKRISELDSAEVDQVKEDLEIDVIRGQLHFSTPAVTTITTQDVFVKAAGTTTSDSLAGMTHANNRLTNTSGKTRLFKIDANVCITDSGSAKLVAIRLAKDGTTIAASQNEGNTGSTDKATIGTSWFVQLANDEFVELFIANRTGTANLTVQCGTLTAYSIDS